MKKLWSAVTALALGFGLAGLGAGLATADEEPTAPPIEEVVEAAPVVETAPASAFEKQDENDTNYVEISYVTVAWNATEGDIWNPAQTVVDTAYTDSPDLNALDDELAALVDGLECGTTDYFQVDVYVDNETSASLIAGGVLYGPNNPAEPLIPGGSGTAWKYVKIVAPECPPPPTNVECTEYGTAPTSTNEDAAGWGNVDTRATGHYEYVEGGLRIYTEGATSTDKVSLGHALSIPLSELGQVGIDYDATFGIQPGINVFVTFAPGLNGTLVWEQVYGGTDFWLTNGSNAGIVAPQTGGGYGSNRHGTIDEWLANYPDAEVTGFAFALGSGVYGDGVIHSVTVGCTDYPFDYLPPIPEEPTGEPDVKVVETLDCTTDTVTITTTTTTPQWELVDRELVEAEPLVEVEVTHRDATEKECPTVVVPPVDPPTELPNGLALTGTDTPYLPIGLGALLLIVAGAGVAVTSKNRSAKSE